MTVRNQHDQVIALFRGKSAQNSRTGGAHMNRTLPLEPIEKASVDELRGLQFKRLQATLHHAYAHSPVYRAKFDAAGVHPSDCRMLV